MSARSLIKVLVVDDSALMRRHLVGLLNAQGDFEVSQARNGREAVELNQEVQPDVVTLDINMPEMDGITALSLLMQTRPVPVVMVSSLTERGALATFEALNLGAVDYVAKPGGTISLSLDAIEGELVRKVRSAAMARVRKRVGPQPTRPPATVEAPRRAAAPRVDAEGIVVIGVSTGGPRTLEDVLVPLPGDLPWPILVAQHMPASFTKPFAERLDQLCALKVVEVSGPTPVEGGTVYVGRGGADLVVGRRAGKPYALIRPESKEHLWHPSVELLGRTALEHFPPTKIVGVMLTGMGNDGAIAFTEIHDRGGRTIAESEETAVVYGMPKELVERKGATVVLPSRRIAARLIEWVGG